MGIPQTQRAAVVEQPGPDGKCVIKEIPVPVPNDDEILVKLSWSGLCHTDVHLIKGDWGNMGLNMTAKVSGHEGVGVVVSVGKNVKRFQVGDRAGIKWVADTCGNCEFCTNGVDELHCARQHNSGATTEGTFQQYVTTSGRYATKVPDGVSDEEAGPILCGGVTAYTALKRSEVKPGQWVVLPGAGGGLGHLAIQYAKAMGMRVIAIDGGNEKGELCKKLGAEVYIDFLAEKDIAAKVMELTMYGAHGVVVTAASRAAYEMAPNLLRPRGTVVCVGLPKDDFRAGGTPMQMVLKKLNVVGSVTATMKDVDEALEFTARGLVKPILVKGTMDDINSFVEKMLAGQLPGRAVIDLWA
ncbi:hypothetical protein VTN00DRAFT_917 [Thermoascus crustaceus]|uniref:uncharacterized protein n=1 Tax=Thermoascus crustaceus TaxID=5088 RepID=UPI00374484A5